MTRPFEQVFVVGQPLEVGAPSDLLTLPRQQCPDVLFRAFDTSAVGLAALFRTQKQGVVNLDELTNWGSWAPSGEITTVFAEHLPTPRNLFDPQLPAHQWGAGIGLLAAWAGRSYQQVLDLFSLAKPQFTAAVGQLLQDARAALQGRRLRVLTLTERPLLGADSVLSADPDSLPVRGLVAADLARVAGFYQAAKDFLLSETLLPAAAAPDRDWNPARAEGSGAGYGLGALPALLRGFRGRGLDAFIEITHLRAQLTSRTLVVAVVPKLHPQTAAGSVLGVLKDVTAQAGVPLIVFCEESSLSKHELFEWNVTACYGGRGTALQPADFARILTQTWLRTR